jgi:hypothetical protein
MAINNTAAKDRLAAEEWMHLIIRRPRLKRQPAVRMGGASDSPKSPKYCEFTSFSVYFAVYFALCRIEFGGCVIAQRR